MRHELGLAVLIASAAIAGAHADDRDPARAFVDRHCGACHAVAPGQIGNHPNAPPFVDIVARYEPTDLAEAFAEGFITGHPDMPTLEFTTDEVTLIVGYLERLRQ